MMNNIQYKECRLYEVSRETIRSSTYNMTMGVTVLYGIIVNIFMISTFSDAICSMNYITMIGMMIKQQKKRHNFMQQVFVSLLVLLKTVTDFSETFLIDELLQMVLISLFYVQQM